MGRGSILVLLPTVAVVIVAALYQVGLFDRPAFEEVILEPELYLILASSNAKDIGGNVERLLKGTLDAVESVAKEKMAPAAASYGAPQGADRLSVGLYFDDPMEKDQPRWGLGWALQLDSDEEFQAIHTQVSKVSALEEPIRAVKIGGGTKVVRGRIPWRMSMTPAIAPLLHWGRAFKFYEQGNYKSDSGREEEDGSVACEIYVTGKDDSMEYIDYTVLMGDTKAIFDAMFPTAIPDKVKEEAATAEEQSSEAKTEDEVVEDEAVEDEAVEDVKQEVVTDEAGTNEDETVEEAVDEVVEEKATEGEEQASTAEEKVVDEGEKDGSAATE